MSERPEIGNPSPSPKPQDEIPGDLVIAQKGHGDWLRRGQLQVIPSFGSVEDTVLSERIHRRRSKHFPPLLVRSISAVGILFELYLGKEKDEDLHKSSCEVQAPALGVGGLHRGGRLSGSVGSPRGVVPWLRPDLLSHRAVRWLSW